MRRSVIIGGISFLCFISIYILFLLNALTSIDETIYQLIYSIQSPFFDSFFKWISLSCNAIPIIVILVGVLFILKKPYNYLTIFNVCMAVGMNQILKRIIQRVRPDHIRLVTESGYSFPSGHSMVSFVLYGMIIYYIYKYVQNKYLKVIGIILLSILILLIGISRIYVGVHYPSDVVAGYCLSLSIILYVSLLYQYYSRGKLE